MDGSTFFVCINSLRAEKKVAPDTQSRVTIMALIICPDCGKEVETSLKNCPNCGRPLQIQQKYNSFSTGSLLPNERILCSANWHAIVYLIMLFCCLVSLVFFVLWIMGVGEKGIVWGVYFPLFIILALFGVYGFIAINHNEFVITNKRIIIKSGIIRRASYELRLEMLESIQMYQGIFGRMLNYGTILVHGVGASRQSVMWIESPLEFRQHIFKELNNN